jgi:protoporphyrinogen oxidase
VTQDWDVCVVGAGPSGLTIAYELLKGGARVLLIERDERVGGLAKSHIYDGHVFDSGPKRFHTDDQVVLAFLQDIMRGDLLTIPRSTEVNFLGRYFEWPLRMKDVWQMPFGLSLRSLFDMLFARAPNDKDSFHQYIRSRYGEALYETFFEPYTGKFLRWEVEDIHSDWASTGINRTVVDSRIQAHSTRDLLKRVLLPSKIKTEFLYPNKSGFGGFYERLLGICRSFGGFRCWTGQTVRRLRRRGRALEGETTRGGEFLCEHLVWSGNLNDLGKVLGDDFRLPYLNTVFYNVICRADEVIHKGTQWIYVTRGDALISRITCMKEFAGYTCPEGYYNFICEVTDSQRYPVYFTNPEAHRDAVLRELSAMKFLRQPGRVEAIHVNPVVDTYPIYHRAYLEQFDLAAAKVKRFSKNIHLIGRCGAFWYNNSDHAIRFALECARTLLGKQEGEFDYRGYFGGACGRAAHPKGV